MKNKLQYALYALNEMEQTSSMRSSLHLIDARAKVIVTVVFLVTMLTVPLSNLSDLMLFALYPLWMSAMGRMRYYDVFKRSLVVLPFVVFIGMFNPIYDRQVAFYVGQYAVSRGWVSFLSIIVRGLLSVQAVVVLIQSTGFHALCRALGRLGVPSVFTTQLLFVYRYMFVLLQEALSLSRARDARSFGRKSYSIRVWSTMVGQLLIRTFDRAERVHQAMLARGFSGRVSVLLGESRWRGADTAFVAVCSGVLIALRVWLPAESFTYL